ncbi:hypothetical protein M0R88_10335 [Halorussus gelatinilyticus]|uniref:Uncharacterized protein n=1 Tax=Halorussus gelatinilyticus TaxID=2937524 RepID=A0A8U0IFU6_9EURY|nr:hypothetical protein [Halorussus gelatinilyticus]UPV98928.1 hypothetical protein M0R88_10335 [Halorussus gelatinilyticus]
MPESPRRFSKPVAAYALGSVAGLALVSNTASAQQVVGSDLCGTPLADTINFAAPLFVGLLMIASAILAYILHNAAAFPKDPQSVESVKNWRNRATFSAVTTPLFAVVIQLLIQSTGVGLAECVNIIPFF